jgi:RNA polymerase sigma-70 factor (ECF subfamily)
VSRIQWERLEADLGSADADKEQDSSLVERARKGDRDSFEKLVREHHGRIYRTLLGITGNREDAEDLTQMAFLKAYEHLGNFQGTAKFSTWLTRIAINEGLQRLRARRPMESLDDAGDDDEEFRPRQVRAWSESPEQAFSRNELRSLVEQELMRLPEKYRLVVMLRDLEELSTEETAQALGLGTAVVKTRLLRGRLMLRERLAPRFTVSGEKARRG